MEGIRIAWDARTLRKISSDNFRNAGYARMIQLKDNTLRCIYEADGNTVITSSEHVNFSWSEPIIIAARQNSIAMAVPDILQLQDGSLLAMYNPRPRGTDTTQHFGIKTKKSYDGGQTWTDERTLYQAGSKFEDGCWEPSAIQMPDGEIQLFFANEGPFTKTNEQNISMVRSKDGGLTWSTAIAVSFRKGSRDGMPVPVLLKDSKEIIFAIEDNGFKNFKPYMIRSGVKNNWAATVDAKSADREYVLADKIPDSIYAGAPYLRQLPSGETILSYQGTEGRINNMNHSEMKVVIGDPSGRNFTRKSVPFDLKADRSGLWNSLTVLDNGDVAALTSTANYSDKRKGEVVMIRGHVMPEIMVKKNLAVPDGTNRQITAKDKYQMFIGQKGPVNLRGYFAADNKDLHLTVKVADLDTVASNPPDVELFIDPQNRSYDMPGKSIFKLSLTANGEVTVFEGEAGQWEKINQRFKVSLKKQADGYFADVALPWKFLGGQPKPNTRMGFNMSLIVPPNGSKPGYTETISGNETEKPFTWCTLKLY
ncbi:exo-alpha-sialidase [Mucilaginibacter myungsuensis]